jgi:hypothetical protein
MWYLGNVKLKCVSIYIHVEGIAYNSELTLTTLTTKELNIGLVLSTS